MARMHSRRKGISGSDRIFRTDPPSWIPLSGKEVEELVVRLYNQGNSTAKIGLVLRDSYGIPDVKLLTGRTITRILQDNGIIFKIPEDMENLMREAIRIHEHLQNNRKDLHNKRNFQLTEAKIRRLQKYYKRKGVLPEGFSYSIKTAKLLVE